MIEHHQIEIRGGPSGFQTSLWINGEQQTNVSAIVLRVDAAGNNEATVTYVGVKVNIDVTVPEEPSHG